MGFNNNKDGLSNIESILKKNGLPYDSHWNPTNVDIYKRNLCNGELSDLTEPVKSQIVYSLQYLDFLKILIDDIKMHNVIEAELYKTFLITSVSIIEAILYHIVKKNFLSGNISKKLISSIAKTEEEIPIIDSKCVVDGMERRMKVSFINELEFPEWNDEVRLIKLIDVTEKSRLGICNSKGYKTLQNLREMRNKIHLTIGKQNETDRQKFTKCWYYSARESLHFLLTCDKFDVADPEIYDFIKLNEDEEKDYKTLNKWS